ncbi:MAG: class I SAM-dependent methyltransferase [Rhizobiaceae bacterium]|nr:MAG: class I SAM-dependent methyltransferase [Rhizobiaceae bacterium]
MTALGDRLKRLIAAQGPVNVSDYMATCLYDPAHGYYMSHEPFGLEGDFTTAPEISQMFGELLAAWLYNAWVEAGRPLPATVVEIGPGRGTLMQDMLRVFSKLDGRFLPAVTVALVETSPRLSGIQKARLASAPKLPVWHTDIATLPDTPLFIVGNEIFDAIPIRQYVRVKEGWRERLVALDDKDDFRFVAGPGTPDPALLPAVAKRAPAGTIVEFAPARSALMDKIAARIAAKGGAGLFIDYGYLEPGTGDTLQALRQHAYDDVFAHPGEADLTAHVDFAALAAAAGAAGLQTQLSTQGDFLLKFGLLERAGHLGAGGDAVLQARLQAEVERLARPDQMGTLFKVLELKAGRTA